MILRQLRMSPVDGVDTLNKALEGAVHVETYTRNEGRYGDRRTIIIFAFYPDEINLLRKDAKC